MCYRTHGPSEHAECIPIHPSRLPVHLTTGRGHAPRVTGAWDAARSRFWRRRPAHTPPPVRGEHPALAITTTTTTSNMCDKQHSSTMMASSAFRKSGARRDPSIWAMISRHVRVLEPPMPSVCWKRCAPRESGCVRRPPKPPALQRLQELCPSIPTLQFQRRQREARGGHGWWCPPGLDHGRATGCNHRRFHRAPSW